VALDFDLRPNFQNFARRVDEKRRTLYAFGDLAVHVFFDDHAERVAKLRIDVRKELERNVVLRFEFLMRGDRVAADADNLDAFALEARVCVAELRRFVRSTRCVVFRIKPQNQRLIEKIAAVHRLARIVEHRNARHLRAYVEHTRKIVGEDEVSFRMSEQGAHPLALELAERTGARPGFRVLELGCGRGRNTNALREAGLEVHAIEDERLMAPLSLQNEAFDAALSTHGFLHGTPADIAALIRETARALRHDAPLFATFASTKDPRYGQGQRVDEQTYAPNSGNEAGVPHVYYDEPALRRLLGPIFEIETLEEIAADSIVGRWAHTRMPSGTVHWFARLRKR
jgi:SAM-dependent methyltransferase